MATRIEEAQRQKEKKMNKKTEKNMDEYKQEGEGQSNEEENWKEVVGRRNT